MFKFFRSFDHRTVNADRLRRNEQDRVARAARLAPQKVAEFTELVNQVSRTVESGDRPCSYEPWKAALKEYSRTPPYIGELPDDWDWLPSKLMNFARDIAQPGWPEPRLDLIEFAIAFLEADVMLFNSGYIKRHLIKRLQQSLLSEEHVSRIDVLLRRASTQGTGLEEARAFRKLAAHLYVHGHVPDLVEWLKDQSEGAVLTLGRMHSSFTLISKFSKQDQKQLLSGGVFRPSKWGVLYPNMNEVVPAGKLLKERNQQIKSTAFLMLDAIQAREASEPKSKYC